MASSEEENLVVDAGRKATFILRLSVDDAGGVSGVVERVKTREQRRIHGLEAIGPIIAGMMTRERAEARPSP